MIEDIKSYLKINRAEFVLGEFGWSFVLTWTQSVYLLSGRVCTRRLRHGSFSRMNDIPDEYVFVILPTRIPILSLPMKGLGSGFSWFLLFAFALEKNNLHLTKPFSVSRFTKGVVATPWELENWTPDTSNKYNCIAGVCARKDDMGVLVGWMAFRMNLYLQSFLQESPYCHNP